MTREEIEKVASQSAFMETPDARERFLFSSGFKTGAEWCINSVWNKNDVTPGYDCHVLIEDIYGNVYDDRYDANYDEYDSAITKKEIKRWAYIKDLLPKEDEKC